MELKGSSLIRFSDIDNTNQKLLDLLKKLNKEISDIEHEKNDLYQYYKYKIASIKLKYSSLNDEEKQVCILNQGLCKENYFKIEKVKNSKKKQSPNTSDQNQFEEYIAVQNPQNKNDFNYFSCQQQQKNGQKQFGEEVISQSLNNIKQPSTRQKIFDDRSFIEIQNMNKFQDEEEEEQTKILNQNYQNNNCYLKQQQNQSQSKDIIENFKLQFILVLGNSGNGKSTFIKKITKNQNILCSNEIQSCTKECNNYKKDGIFYIDTPGLNDTQDYYQNLLKIVVFLLEQNIFIKNIFFLCISNTKEKNFQRILDDFLYVYFLYELFKQEIDPILAEELTKEFRDSFYFLKWQNLKSKNNEEKIYQILKQKDKILNYLQHANSFHIFVNTFFDTEEVPVKNNFDQYQANYLKEQIWSNKQNTNDLLEYEAYIQNQEYHLKDKIQKIIELENKILQDSHETKVNILIIGKQGVGKSLLIKQLTGIQYEKQSPAYFCQIYPFKYEETYYQLIDTPGFYGSAQRDPFECYMIIADYLRRNDITEFKILLLKCSETDIRDNTFDEINKLHFFIQTIFGQQMPLVDTQDAYNLFGQDNQKVNVEQMQRNILKVQMIKKERQKEGIIYPCPLNFKCVEFKNNFIFQSKEYKVPDDQDSLQKNTLFKGIRQIQSVYIDDIIMLRIKKINQFKILKNESEYIEKFKEMGNLYLELQSIQKESNKQKINKQQTINQKNFIMFQDFRKNQQYQNEINEYIEIKLGNNAQIQNNIRRHFVILEWNQTKQIKSDSLIIRCLLSRKLFYYQNLCHHLKPFIDISNQNHKIKIENMAKIKLMQEIINVKYIQEQCIDENFQKDPKELDQILKTLLQSFNLMVGTGGQIFRLVTYFNLLVKSYDVLSGLNLGLFTINIVLPVICIGLDIYFYSKKFICKSQMTINTISNLACLAIASIGICIPGLGWLVGGFAAFIGISGNLISKLIFTSKEKFEDTIVSSFKQIMDDNILSMQYFQKAEFLQQKLNLINYSQLKQAEGFELFRKIMVKDTNNLKEIPILFGGSEDVQNKISNHIVKEILIPQFVANINKINSQDQQETKKQIINACNKNKKILRTYFNNCGDQKQMLKQINDQMKQLQIQLKKQNVDQINNSIESCNKIFKEFIESLNKKEYTYNQQKEFANGIFRKNNRFPILFNSYCYITSKKLQYLYDQEVITELIKDSKSKQFNVNIELNADIFLKQESNDQEIFDQSDQISNETEYQIIQQFNVNNDNSIKLELTDLGMHGQSSLIINQTKDYFGKSKQFNVNNNNSLKLELTDSGMLDQSSLIIDETKNCFVESKQFNENNESFEDNFLKLKINHEEIIDQLNLISQSQKFMESRYIQKYENQNELNLTSIDASKYNYEGNLIFCVDLYEIAQQNADQFSFIQAIKDNNKIKQILSYYNQDRLFDFYNSCHYLNDRFQIKQNSDQQLRI
ncbi:hypothetical protein ABPG72_017473 [Tetrahymena utriculariae]